MAAATTARAKGRTLRGGSCLYGRCALLWALCREVASLSAGKAGFAFGLALEGNKSTSDLVGKGMGIFAKRNHILKGLIMHASLEEGTACRVVFS